MPLIKIETVIQAPQKRCFLLALSVDLHTVSTQQTKESIVAGVRSGILQLGDTVTFRAQHFGIWQTLTSKVTELETPIYFCDEMQQGAFQRMRHEHHFEKQGNTTLMRDVFEFASPLGWVGKAVDTLFMKRYLTHFLKERCSVIKHYAETEAWREVLPLMDNLK
ncbi:SRPBCC family protein [Hymenobacter sp. NBH84]|nr:SRPBCC family protein [Hymenobacter sp. NBH84]